jgi:hypothetical protein
MAANFTFSQGLIETITNQSWFANPAGIEGREVILLEKVGDRGSRYYCTLKPGQTLRLGERIFSKYDALSIDMRLGRTFPISGSFSTRDRGKKVSISANVRYHVTNSETLALKVADPLGELRDKVTAALNRDLTQYPEGQIDAGLIEKIIRNVGPVPSLGLEIDDADVMSFEQDSGVTEHVKNVGKTKNEIELQELKRRAELDAKRQQNDADIIMRRDRHDNISLTDLNVLMHEYPDLVPQVFGHFAGRDQEILQSQLKLMEPVIQAYIAQKIDEGAPIDPDELAKVIRRTVTSPKGQLEGSMGTPKQIAWGESTPEKLPPEKPSIQFEEDEEKDNDKDDGRIKFGDL